ncbi:ShlB/FhaC/HecB family hemolysin secretion/activation protein, partial [Steroidobacter sp.]|uniref:ShlB/FhaC/HecB family hemolysin secretion/activation protein n=1 Tax=Steroidobacter sp. TaxID=1978227 RepID=UPI001A404AA9
RAAAEITNHYRDAGYLVARAYLPAQEIRDGVVEISVLEGRIGNVVVNVDGRRTRIDQRHAEKYVKQTVAVGDVVRDENVERGLLLLNDLPALDVRSTLQPGASVGTSDLVVEAEGRSLFDGSVDADSYGSRYTGEIRVGGTINFNNPAGWGDVLSLRGLTTNTGDMRFGRLSYTVPVDARGTRIGLAYTYVDYEIGKDFRYLHANGDARVASAYVLHPFVRTRTFSLYGSVGYDQKWYRSDINDERASDKKGNVWLAGLSGEKRDDFGGAGLNEFGVTVFHGAQKLDGSPDQFVDSLTTHTHGNFTKVNFNVARLQDLDGLFSVRVALSGQFSSRNLNSGEQFVLGGPFGIRAWPQGEAAGDRGLLGNLELHWDRSLQWGPSNLQLLAFFDAGRIRLHESTWSGWQGGNPHLRNEYVLYGAGLGANYSSLDNFVVRTSYGWQLSSNPGRDILGRDSDNTSRDGHFWLQAMKWFR